MKKIGYSLFTMTAMLALAVACSSPDNSDDDDNTGGNAGKGGQTGGRAGSSARGGSGGESNSAGTGGTSTAGGSGGTSSGGAGGMVNSGGTGGTSMGGSGAVPPYEQPFDVLISPGEFTSQMGVNIFGGNNTCCIGGVDEGDWTRYAEIDFGPHCAYDKFTVRYASPNDGGIVEVRTGALNGPIIAQINLARTGEEFTTLGEASGVIKPVSGKHELVVRFVGVSFGIGNFTRFIMTASGDRKACP